MSDDTQESSRSFMERIAYSFGGDPRNRGELLEVLQDACHRKLIDNDALHMIEGVFEVAEMKVRDIVIPRGQMVVIEHDAPLDEILSVIVDSGHSRFPVIEDDKDEVLGVLLAKDLIRFTRDDANEAFELKKIVRSATFAPESKRLNVLLKEFRVNRNHMAIVVDEYGGVAGLVTIEDVLEQIVGEIDDEHDQEEDINIRKRDDGSYSVHALTPIDEFNEITGANFSDDEFDTVGGYVMHEAGHMPTVDEQVKIGPITFLIESADSRRIHLMRVWFGRLPPILEEEQ